MSMKRRVAIYVRVSTDGQTTMNQQRELETVVKRHDWKVIDVFRDQGISGKNGRKQRPALTDSSRASSGRTSTSLQRGQWIVSAARCNTS